MTSFERYLRNVQVRQLLRDLKVKNVEALMNEVEHFTENEAKRRDKIVMNYFGEDGVNRIVDSLVQGFLSPLKPEGKVKVLDVGAGSGFFTIRVVNMLRQLLPRASFYALDLTPAMLRALVKKAPEIVSFVGVAENVKGSVEHAKRYLSVPEKYDGIFSTLMLHHCLNVEKVFESFKEVLSVSGKALVVDLLKHPFEEFREEMGDVHLGFEPKLIREIAEKQFSRVTVKKIPGIQCDTSGRTAELFIAQMMLE